MGSARRVADPAVTRATDALYHNFPQSYESPGFARAFGYVILAESVTTISVARQLCDRTHRGFFENRKRAGADIERTKCAGRTMTDLADGRDADVTK